MRATPAVRRRIGIAVLAVAAVLTTAACATGQQAPTANESPAIDGNNAAVGSIQLHDVAILAPPGGPSYPAGSAAEVTAVIVNNGTADDALVGVSANLAKATALYANITDAAAVITPAATSATGSLPATDAVSPSGGATSSAPGSATATAGTSTSSGASTAPLTSLTIGAGELVSLGVNDTDHVLVLTGLTQQLFPGAEVSMTFTFQNAGSVSFLVPVQLTDTTLTPLIVPSLSGS